MQHDEAQAEVAGHGRGPLMVNAGPGTGKTRCLTARFAALVQAGLAAPTDILAVTFTREAAAVMRQRVQQLLGQDVEGLRISTIHSLAYSILRLGGQRRLKVAPPEEAYEHFKRAALEVGLSHERWDIKGLFHAIANLKERLIGVDQYQAIPGSIFQENLQRVYRRYQRILSEEGLLDFGDLVMKAIEKLYGDPTLLSFIQSITPFVMVDEFQDTSRAQYELIRLLVGDNRNILVVGSPAQTIHEWRGAQMNELREAFQQDFPTAGDQTLHTNYRSTGAIVEAASAVGEGYPDAVQNPSRSVGERVRVWRPADQFEEAGRVALAVRQWLNEGISPEEIGVLYRTHRQADPLESQLSASGIPYQMTGVERLYDRPEVRTLLAYLDLIVDSDQDGLLEQVVNVPPRGLGPNAVARIKGTDPILTMDALRTAAQGGNGLPSRVMEASAQFIAQIEQLRRVQDLPPQTAIETILDVTGYRAWTEDLLDGRRQMQALGQVAQDAAGFDNLAAYLEYAQERATCTATGGIQLSTIHAAKGREWKMVIVVGVVEGLLPHSAALKEAQEPEEERRLLYVAMTRPKDILIISMPHRHVRSQGAREVIPSRYLRRVPRELFEVE